MHPILFTINNFQIYSWGAMLLISLSAALTLVSWSAKHHGKDREKIIDACLLLLILGVIGARIAYISTHLDYYIHGRILEVVQIWTGGMSFHGALAVGLIALPFVSRKLGLTTLSFGDILAPAMALGYGLQRFGCLLNGDSYGRLTNGFWGVQTGFAEGLRQPVQLYDAFLNLILFVILIKITKARPRQGFVMAIYLIGSATARFITEFFRVSPHIFGWVTQAQLISLLMIISTLVGIFLIQRQSSSHQVNHGA